MEEGDEEEEELGRGAHWGARTVPRAGGLEKRVGPLIGHREAPDTEAGERDPAPRAVAALAAAPAVR